MTRAQGPRCCLQNNILRWVFSGKHILRLACSDLLDLRAEPFHSARCYTLVNCASLSQILRNARQRVTNIGLAARVFCSMAIPVPYALSGASRLGRCACAPIALLAIALCGCSITLGSLSPSAEREESPQLTSSSNIASLTETIKNNPNDPQAYNMRGSVLAQAGKTEDALADFNKAISLDPNYGQAFANRGLIYRKTKRLDQAMADYERALALDPGYAPAWLGRGMVYKARNQAPQALEDLNKAISLRPDNAEAYYNRGLLYQGEKQHQFAIDDFTTANGLSPQLAEPLLARALSYLALDKAKEAAADLDEAVQSDPQNAQIWITRGLAYERLGDKNKSAGSYGRAINLRPKDEAARSGFARVGGKPGQAYETF
jgi:tetratricopeptide (TPR) repeat protein